MAKPLKPESVFAIQSVLKRTLQPHEIETGVLDRQPRKATLPSRDLSDEEFAAHVMSQPFNQPFAPVAKSDDGADPFAGIVAEAEAEAERERVNKLSPAQRKLYEVKQAQAALAKSKVSAAAVEAHKAKHADTLKALNDLNESVLSDPYWEAQDIAAINNAIQQIEFGPLGDPAALQKLLADVEGIKSAKVVARKAGLTAKLKEAGLDDGEIANAIATRFPDPSKKAATQSQQKESGDPEWYALSDKSVALYETWNTLKASPDAKPEDVKAARKVWMEAAEITSKTKAAYELAQATATAGASEGGSTEGGRGNMITADQAYMRRGKIIAEIRDNGPGTVMQIAAALNDDVDAVARKLAGMHKDREVSAMVANHGQYFVYGLNDWWSP